MKDFDEKDMRLVWLGRWQIAEWVINELGDIVNCLAALCAQSGDDGGGEEHDDGGGEEHDDTPGNSADRRASEITR